MPINDDFTYDILIAKTDYFEPYRDKDFEKISIMKSVPWYANFVNYLDANIIPPWSKLPTEKEVLQRC